MARKAKWPPEPHRHSSGQARVKWKGEVYYLGKYGSDEARKAHAELLVRLADGKEEATPRSPGMVGGRATVAEAMLAYRQHALGHYRKPSGEQTSEMAFVERVIDLLLERHGDLLAGELRPRHIREVRERMVAKGWCRNNVNAHVRRIKTAWHWLADQEMVPAECWQALRAVRPLEAGRSEARETAPVGPAPLESIEAVLPLLTPHLGEALRLLLWTAARPGEVLGLQAEQVQRTGDVWSASLTAHKTAHKGRQRLLLFGPRAQAVLRRLELLRCPRCGEMGRARRLAWRGETCGPCADWREDHQATGPWPDPAPGRNYYLICPGESDRERREIGRRRAAMPRKGQLRSPRTQLARYGVRELSKAIRRACRAAGVPAFSPNQVRHTAATLIVAEVGYETARIILGHSSVSVTRIYAADDLARASEALRRLG